MGLVAVRSGSAADRGIGGVGWAWGGRTGKGGVRTPRSQCPARFCQNGAGWESARGGRAALLSGPGGAGQPLTSAPPPLL